VISKQKEETLAPHRPIDHALELEPGHKIPYGRIYNLSEVERKTLKAYVETHSANVFTQRSSSSAAAPIFFAKMKDGGLRLYVDYQAINSVTIKNGYPNPQISEMFYRLLEASIFTKLDLRNAYHLIQIKEGDEYKTALRTWYGQFEYRVMPFGLTNTPATFQAYMHDCFRTYIDNFAVCYLDDIVIYSTTEKQHEEHVRKVQQRLQVFSLYCKAEKCQFGVAEVGFLGFIENSEGMSIETD
jgi:hypothetical protein